MQERDERNGNTANEKNEITDVCDNIAKREFIQTIGRGVRHKDD